VPLPYFGAARVTALLRNYVRFSPDADGARAEQVLVSGTVGCPRAVQFLLLVLHGRACNVADGGRPSTSDMPELLREARSRWMSCGTTSFMQATNDHVDIAVRALMATAFPASKGGHCCVVDDITAARFPMALILPEWLEAAHVGALRLRVSGSDVVMFSPYPFLEHYLNNVSAVRRLELKNCQTLVDLAHVLPHWVGVFGRGKAFEYALALELCILSSPVLKMLLRCDGLGHLSMLPFAVGGVCTLQEFSTTADLPSDEDLLEAAFVTNPRVFVARDGQASNVGRAVARPADIALPVRFVDAHGGTRYTLLLIELKSTVDPASPQYSRTGLGKYVELSRSPTAAAWPLSCFVSTVDVSPLGSRSVGAVEERLSYNVDGASHAPVRAMGLLHLSSVILESAVLNLSALLHSSDESFGTKSVEQWHELLFEDAVMRQHVAERGGAGFGSAIQFADAAAAATHALGALALGECSGCSKPRRDKDDVFCPKCGLGYP